METLVTVVTFNQFLANDVLAIVSGGKLLPVCDKVIAVAGTDNQFMFYGYHWSEAYLRRMFAVPLTVVHKCEAEDVLCGQNCDDGQFESSNLTYPQS